jgi:hypothetical protein
MFELSRLSTGNSEDDVIPIEEEGEHLAAFLKNLTVPSYAIDSVTLFDVAKVVAILSISRTFNFRSMRSAAEKALELCLRIWQWSVLEGASDRQDRELGRRAIGEMKSGYLLGQPDIFWDILGRGDLRSEWKLEMAQRIFPVLVYGQTGWNSTIDGSKGPASAAELKRAAALFNPK